jgi:hypothetical protein
MSGWGIALGGLLGGLSGVLVGSGAPYAVSAFALAGAVVGVASGLLLGLLTGITLVLFSLKGLPTDIKGYLRVARAIGFYWIILGALAIGLFSNLKATNLPIYLVCASIVGLIMGGAVWWASGKVVRWVDQELETPA